MVFTAFWVPYLTLFAASMLPTIDYGRVPFGVYLLTLVWLSPVLTLWIATHLQHRTWTERLDGRRRVPSTRRIDRAKRNFSEQDFRLATMLALIYLAAALKVYVIDGTVLSDGITASRYARIASGGEVDAFGVLDSMTSGAPGVFGAVYLDRLMSGKRRVWYADVLLPVSFFALFLSGGRNGFALNTIFLLSFALLRGDVLRVVRQSLPSAVRNMKRRTKYLILAGCAYSMSVFLTRVDVRGDRSFFDRLYSIENNFDLQLQALRESGMTVSVGPFLVTDLYFYLTSAFHHIGRYFQDSEVLFTNGGYTFYPFFRIVDVVAGTNLSGEVFDRLLVEGVFYTLPGSLYIDFGLVGTAVASVIWTALAIVVVGRARAHGGASMLLASYMLLTLVVSGLFSAFAISGGPSLLVLSLLFMALQTIRRLHAGQRLLPAERVAVSSRPESRAHRWSRGAGTRL